MKKLLSNKAVMTVLGLTFVVSAKAQYDNNYGLANSGVSNFGDDTAPSDIITYNGTTFSIMTTGQGPFDGNDDTWVGVVNNSSKPITSINLSSTQDIFGFDGDGIDDYGSKGNASDNTGYGGAQAWYSGIVIAATETGTVNFINGGIPVGETGYFSLEEDLSGASGGVPGGGNLTVTGVPDGGSTLGLLGLAMVGIGAVRRKMTF